MFVALLALGMLWHFDPKIVSSCRTIVTLLAVSFMKLTRAILPSLRLCRLTFQLRHSLSVSDLKDFARFKVRKRILDYFECGYIRSTPTSKYKEIVYFSEGGNKYRVRYPKTRRRPRNIFRVMSENKDISDEFFEVYGPDFNFHGISSTPRGLGWKEGISIEYFDETGRFFDADQTLINLNN